MVESLVSLKLLLALWGYLGDDGDQKACAQHLLEEGWMEPSHLCLLGVKMLEAFEAQLAYSQGCLIIAFRHPQCPRHSIMCHRKNGIRLNGQDRQGLCHQHLQQLLNGESKISLSQQQLARPISCLSFCKNPIRGDLLTSTKAGVTGNMGRGGIAG